VTCGAHTISLLAELVCGVSDVLGLLARTTFKTASRWLSERPDVRPAQRRQRLQPAFDRRRAASGRADDRTTEAVLRPHSARRCTRHTRVPELAPEHAPGFGCDRVLRKSGTGPDRRLHPRGGAQSAGRRKRPSRPRVRNPVPTSASRIGSHRSRSSPDRRAASASESRVPGTSINTPLRRSTASGTCGGVDIFGRGVRRLPARARPS